MVINSYRTQVVKMLFMYMSRVHRHPFKCISAGRLGNNHLAFVRSFLSGEYRKAVADVAESGPKHGRTCGPSGYRAK